MAIALFFSPRAYGRKYLSTCPPLHACLSIHRLGLSGGSTKGVMLYFSSSMTMAFASMPRFWPPYSSGTSMP